MARAIQRLTIVRELGAATSEQLLRHAFALARVAASDDLDDASFPMATEHPKAMAQAVVASRTQTLI
jgi:hypothetical protein